MDRVCSLLSTSGVADDVKMEADRKSGKRMSTGNSTSNGGSVRDSNSVAGIRASLPSGEQI